MENQEQKINPVQPVNTMPRMDNEPPQSPEPSSQFTGVSNKPGSGFKIFVIFSIIVIVVIYAGRSVNGAKLILFLKGL